MRLHDGILTCHGGCVLMGDALGEVRLFQIEEWFYQERRRNLKRLIAEKARLGLPLTVSIQEERLSWNGPVPVRGKRAARGVALNFDR